MRMRQTVIRGGNLRDNFTSVDYLCFFFGAPVFVIASHLLTLQLPHFHIIHDIWRVDCSRGSPETEWARASCAANKVGKIMTKVSACGTQHTAQTIINLLIPISNRKAGNVFIRAPGFMSEKCHNQIARTKHFSRLKYWCNSCLAATANDNNNM